MRVSRRRERKRQSVGTKEAKEEDSVRKRKRVYEDEVESERWEAREEERARGTVESGEL